MGTINSLKADIYKTRSGFYVKLHIGGFKLNSDTVYSTKHGAERFIDRINELTGFGIDVRDKTKN